MQNIAAGPDYSVWCDKINQISGIGSVEFDQLSMPKNISGEILNIQAFSKNIVI